MRKSDQSAHCQGTSNQRSPDSLQSTTLAYSLVEQYRRSGHRHTDQRGCTTLQVQTFLPPSQVGMLSRAKRDLRAPRPPATARMRNPLRPVSAPFRKAIEGVDLDRPKVDLALIDLGL